MGWETARKMAFEWIETECSRCRAPLRRQKLRSEKNTAVYCKTCQRKARAERDKERRRRGSPKSSKDKGGTNNRFMVTFLHDVYDASGEHMGFFKGARFKRTDIVEMVTRGDLPHDVRLEDMNGDVFVTTEDGLLPLAEYERRFVGV